MLIFLLACDDTKLACGPGTHEEAGLCVPDAEAQETAEPDEETAETAETAEPGETAETAETAAPEPVIEVYILAGQSNMDGYGVYSGLPPTWLEGNPDVPLYWSGWGAFRPLAPASYGGSAYAGPEVGIGWTLSDAGRRVALVKHAVGGTDLYAYWYPGDTSDEAGTGAGWSTLLATMAAAKVELDAAGEPWRWAGFVWMQGESDALYESWAAAYPENLTRLLRRVREETETEDLPAVIGLIACEGLCTYLDTVREAQLAVAEADPYVETVETNDLPRTWYDPWHYDGVSNRLLGERFAQALLGEAPDAQVQAALEVESYATNYDGEYTVGWVFEVDRPITITDVGAFSAAGSYLYTTAELGIWDNDSGVLVARETVPDWYAAPTSYRDGFWYTAVEPIALEPGSYAIGLVSWSGDYDRYADSAVVTEGEGLTVTAGAYVSSYWLSYPLNQFAADADGLAFLGPGFLYQER